MSLRWWAGENFSPRRRLAAAFMCVVVGIFFGFIQFRNIDVFIDLATDGQIVEATMIGFREDRSPRVGRDYYPTFRFISANGKTYEFESYAPIVPSSYKQGKQIEVVYLTDNPSIVMPTKNLKTWWYFGFWLWLSMVAVMLVSAGIQLWAIFQLPRHGVSSSSK